MKVKKLKEYLNKFSDEAEIEFFLKTINSRSLGFIIGEEEFKSPIVEQTKLEVETLNKYCTIDFKLKTD